MKNFKIGSVVRTSDNTYVLVTSKVNKGTAHFSGVVLRCEDRVEPWAVGMLSDTWESDAFMKTSINMSELMNHTKTMFSVLN